MQEAEFIRGNQKSYIRIPCDTAVLLGSEYRMCAYNKLNSLLEFQQRSQNGRDYLYYDITGMQSLDVFLQTQKLRRTIAMRLAKSIAGLCREISEYALDIHKIIFLPKYVMTAVNGELVRFVYGFVSDRNGTQELENFLESFVEALDYQDELLVEKMYNIYERFLEQQENFSLAAEMEWLCKELEEGSLEHSVQCTESSVKVEAIHVETVFESETEEIGISHIEDQERHNLKRGIAILLCLDIVVVIFWKPMTLLKIFFAVALGVVLIILQIYFHKRGKHQKEENQVLDQEEAYIEEYEQLSVQREEENNYTQFILMEASEGVLYNLQEREPKYIYIKDVPQIIGKDIKKVQVQILQDGISRIHALVQKVGQECIIEDLNSTNGTWVNGKALEPRCRYVLKQGDKVCLAGVEYIFR